MLEIMERYIVSKVKGWGGEGTEAHPQSPHKEPLKKCLLPSKNNWYLS